MFYSVKKENPGTKISAETAAALATTSFVFRTSDAQYSEGLSQNVIRLRMYLLFKPKLI